MYTAEYQQWNTWSTSRDRELVSETLDQRNLQERLASVHREKVLFRFKQCATCTGFMSRATSTSSGTERSRHRLSMHAYRKQIPISTSNPDGRGSSQLVFIQANRRKVSSIAGLTDWPLSSRGVWHRSDTTPLALIFCVWSDASARRKVGQPCG